MCGVVKQVRASAASRRTPSRTLAAMSCRGFGKASGRIGVSVSVEVFHQEASISRAVAAKSQTDSAPLAVKKAALRRDRSPGRTTQCW